MLRKQQNSIARMPLAAMGYDHDVDWEYRKRFARRERMRKLAFWAVALALGVLVWKLLSVLGW